MNDNQTQASLTKTDVPLEHSIPINIEQEVFEGIDVSNINLNDTEDVGELMDEIEIVEENDYDNMDIYLCEFCGENHNGEFCKNKTSVVYLDLTSNGGSTWVNIMDKEKETNDRSKDRHVKFQNERQEKELEHDKQQHEHRNKYKSKHYDEDYKYKSKRTVNKSYNRPRKYRRFLYEKQQQKDDQCLSGTNFNQQLQKHDKNNEENYIQMFLEDFYLHYEQTAFLTVFESENKKVKNFTLVVPAKAKIFYWICGRDTYQDFKYNSHGFKQLSFNNARFLDNFCKELKVLTFNKDLKDRSFKIHDKSYITTHFNFVGLKLNDNFATVPCYEYFYNVPIFPYHNYFFCSKCLMANFLKQLDLNVRDYSINEFNYITKNYNSVEKV